MVVICVCVNDVRARLPLPTIIIVMMEILMHCIYQKKDYTLYVVIFAYMLLFLFSSFSTSLTTHRHIQRGLYNQRRDRTIGSVQCSYFLSYSLMIILRSFFVLTCFVTHILPGINDVRNKSR
jgi:hypothetical protein